MITQVANANEEAIKVRLATCILIHAVSSMN